MTRDFLKGLGIEDKAVLDQIMKQNGEDIEKAKPADYEELKTKLTAAETQLASANEQIKAFEGMDIEGVKKSAAEYKKKFEDAQAEGEKQLAALKFDHALENALAGAKARDSVSVKAHIDREKIKLCKDGSLTGLSEQLEKLKAEKAYLFEAEEDPSKPQFLGGAGGGNAPADDTNAVRAVMGLPPIQ